MKLQAGLCSFLEAVGDRASEFIQVVGRIPFFATEELGSLFLCHGGTGSLFLCWLWLGIIPNL